MHAFQAIYESSPEHIFSHLRSKPKNGRPPPAMFRVAVEAYCHQKMAGLLMAGQPTPPNLPDTP